MATVAAPLRDFSLGTPGNQVHMAGVIGSTTTVPTPVTQYNPTSTPKCAVLCSGGSGGETSYPIAG